MEHGPHHGHYDDEFRDPHSHVLFKPDDALSRPDGVLSIHLKQLKNIKLDFENLFEDYPISLYVRIHIGAVCKNSSVVQSGVTKTQVALDDLRHFAIKLSNKRQDLSNKVKLELIGYESPERHRIIASKQIHLYDIIKKLYSVEALALSRKTKPMAVLEVEFCFAYGSFGYGFSNQLENRQMDPKQQITHSLFLRPEPIAGRTDTLNDLTTPIPVGHPPYIPFKEKVDLGLLGQELGSCTELCQQGAKTEPKVMLARIGRRLGYLQRKYDELESRSARLNYLRQMIISNADSGSGYEEFTVQEDHPEEGSVISHGVKQVLQSAPGITQRKEGVQQVDSDGTLTDEIEARRPTLAFNPFASALARVRGTKVSPDPPSICVTPGTSEGSSPTNQGLRKGQGPPPKSRFGGSSRLGNLVTTLLQQRTTKEENATENAGRGASSPRKT